jgi:molybdopterin-guanine dinucleotide biosynthesis protein A
MGHDKAQLAYAGTPLWRHQWNTLGRTGPAHRFLSVAEDPGFSVDPGCVVIDRVVNAGPLGGLEAALARCEEPLLLVLAVDLPLMDAGYLAGLLEQCRPETGCVPVLGDRYEPLAAVYPGSLLSRVRAFLADRRYALRDLVKEGVGAGLLKPVPVAPREAPLFTNVNTPEEWARLAGPSSE